MQPRPYRGRLAPSPTGAQHVGNARTYLIAWLAARASAGALALRIEDIDSPRVKPGAAEQAMDDLRWLGLDWDTGPIVQTQRLPLYESALRELQTRELVYPCTCTRGDVERAASAPHAEHEGAVYPGTCAHRRLADAVHLESKPYAWRFRAAQVREYTDRFRGRTEVDPRDTGGDFVIWKSAGTPAYQLAVVVDDATMGITDVIRGDDLIPSTPRQLQLYAALGWSAPTFAHVPLVVGPDGRRLAKRHGDTRLSTLRAAGVKPKALLGLLAWSCGWVEQVEPIASHELVPLFRMETIPPGPFMLTPALLRVVGYLGT
ncbi:MAG: tRNA glutamyl-Q(34) synthetase GluQRS [Gemmataceae bacterium]|nr:tRNA glutamyl-Q(34) synthetase GluQRS [Gemmataceae bacterium]